MIHALLFTDTPILAGGTSCISHEYSGVRWNTVSHIIPPPFPAYVVFELVSPVVGESAVAACLFDVFLRALDHSLTEVAYAADVAQLR
jgi:hypothetical protein